MHARASTRLGVQAALLLLCHGLVPPERLELGHERPLSCSLGGLQLCDLARLRRLRPAELRRRLRQALLLRRRLQGCRVRCESGCPAGKGLDDATVHWLVQVMSSSRAACNPLQGQQQRCSPLPCVRLALGLQPQIAASSSRRRRLHLQAWRRRLRAAPALPRGQAGLGKVAGGGHLGHAGHRGHPRRAGRRAARGHGQRRVPLRPPGQVGALRQHAGQVFVRRRPLGLDARLQRADAVSSGARACDGTATYRLEPCMGTGCYLDAHKPCACGCSRAPGSPGGKWLTRDRCTGSVLAGAGGPRPAACGGGCLAAACLALSSAPASSPMSLAQSPASSSARRASAWYLHTPRG